MNVSCVAVTEVMLPWTGVAGPPAVLLIATLGAVPPVSKMNPLGALRMMVPVPTSPLLFSV